MSASLSELLDTAITAARMGGSILIERLELARTVNFKGGGRGDLVTDADQASEAAIVEYLSARYPTHAILAEEGGGLGASDHTWLIDPLDGTTNYAHGVPHFCVTLALEGPVPGGSAILAGVVFDPMRNELFSAARGQGASLNGRPIHVTTQSDLEDALLCSGFPYDVQRRPELPVGLFSSLVTRAGGMRRMGSAALDLAYVACGRYDGYFELGLKPWDIAGGALLVEEAGGTVLRIDGAPFDVWCGDLLASSASLAPPLTEVCREFVREHGWVPRRFGARV